MGEGPCPTPRRTQPATPTSAGGGPLTAPLSESRLPWRPREFCQPRPPRPRARKIPSPPGCPPPQTLALLVFPSQPATPAALAGKGSPLPLPSSPSDPRLGYRPFPASRVSLSGVRVTGERLPPPHAGCDQAHASDPVSRSGVRVVARDARSPRDAQRAHRRRLRPCARRQLPLLRSRCRTMWGSSEAGTTPIPWALAIAFPTFEVPCAKMNLICSVRHSDRQNRFQWAPTGETRGELGFTVRSVARSCLWAARWCPSNLRVAAADR